MLSVDELDRHHRLDSVTLRYDHEAETVYYEWKGRDCWVTKDGKVYLPADSTSLALTAFFEHEVVVPSREEPIQSREERPIRYIRMKQLKDAGSRETNRLWVEVNGKEALAGEEQKLITLS